MKSLGIATIGLVCAGLAVAAEAKQPYAQTGDGTEVWENSAGECWQSVDAAPRWCGEIPDSDGDGVNDELDQCPDTRQGEPVDEQGCPPDADRDGVADYSDVCPDTTYGVRVDTRGCDLDLDGDGVPYYRDRCQTTPPGVEVDQEGCLVKAVLGEVLFAFDKADLTPKAHHILDKIGESLKYRDEVSGIHVGGHTDSIGSRKYNQALSEARAQAVMQYMTSIGCSQPITAHGYGESQPVAPNTSEAGRQQNRRVEIILERVKR